MCANYNRTVLKQSATMDVFGVALVGNLLESLLIASYSSTVSKVTSTVHYPPKHNFSLYQGRLAVEEKAVLIMDEHNMN